MWGVCGGIYWGRFFFFFLRFRYAKDGNLGMRKNLLFDQVLKKKIEKKKEKKVSWAKRTKKTNLRKL